MVEPPTEQELQNKERLRAAVEEALEFDANFGGDELAYKTVERLVEYGVSVMLHGRPPVAANHAGTKRWVVELELFPTCIIEEYDGYAIIALTRACERLFKELDRRWPSA